MKQAALKNPSEILNKIETIEKDVANLKLSILKKFTPSAKKIVSLKGIVKGIDITEEDIKYAKKSLYSRADI